MPNSHIAIRDSWPLVDGIPIPYFNALRDAKSRLTAYPATRIARPAGKLAFGEFVERNGGRAPRTLATIVDGRVESEGAHAGEPARTFLERLPHGHYFCKLNLGSNGKGAMRLDIAPEGVAIDGTMRDFAQATEALSGARYLVQESLTPRQHRLISRFHAGVIDTLRLITFDADGGPVATGAFMRMAIGKATIDSWAGGGVLAPVDLKRGCLHAGILKKGLRLIDAHPESGHRFDGAPVPYLAEAVATACKLHGRLAIASLGWDIGLLEDGPCILESNRHWDVFSTAQFNLEFVHAFLRFHLPQGDTAAARLVLSGSFDDRRAVRLWLCAVVGEALASGRVEDYSRERIVITIAGTKARVESALGFVRRNASRLKITAIGIEPCPEIAPPGLNIGVTF